MSAWRTLSRKIGPVSLPYYISISSIKCPYRAVNASSRLLLRDAQPTAYPLHLPRPLLLQHQQVRATPLPLARPIQSMLLLLLLLLLPNLPRSIRITGTPIHYVRSTPPPHASRDGSCAPTRRAIFNRMSIRKQKNTTRQSIPAGSLLIYASRLSYVGSIRCST